MQRPPSTNAPRSLARRHARGSRRGGAALLVVLAVALHALAVAAADEAITVVLIGERSRCEAAQAGIASAAGVPLRLTWIFRASSPEALAAPSTATELPTLFVDLGQPASARLVLTRPKAPVALRTLAREEDDERLFEESVVQIAAATLRALREGEATPLEPPRLADTTTPTPPAAPPPTTNAQPPAPTAPDSAAITATTSKQVAAASATASSRSSWWEGGWAFDAAMGIHSGIFDFSNDHNGSEAFDLSALAEVRRETRRAVFALRGTFERNIAPHYDPNVATRFHGLALVAMWTKRIDWLQLSLGATAGVLVLRQETKAPDWGGTLAFPWAYNSVTWSTGWLAGPCAEVLGALGQRMFVIAHVATPLAILPLRDSGASDSSWRTEPYLQVLGGLGVRL